MRRYIGWMVLGAALASVLGSSIGRAQNAPPRGQAAPRQGGAQPARTQPAPVDPALEARAAARMEELLQVWARNSAGLKSLDVTIDRVDRSPLDGDDTYLGRAILKSPNLAFLSFDKVVTDQKNQKVPQRHERIVCTGNEVWQYRFDAQQAFVFPLDKKDRQRALEEGPLPFLFNMRADEAKERYAMRLVKEDAKTYVIKVTPRKQIDQDSFSVAYLQLDRKYLLPTRIFLLGPDGKSTKDFTLRNIKPNDPNVKDEWFRGGAVKGWTVHRDPGNNGNAAGQANRQRQPALRGGAAAGRR